MMFNKIRQQILSKNETRIPPPSATDSVSDQLEHITAYSEIKKILDNIGHLQQRESFKSIALLSFLPAEGRTLFAATLAMAYANTWKRKVLIVNSCTVKRSGSLTLDQCLGEPSKPNTSKFFGSHHPLVDMISLSDWVGTANEPSQSADKYRIRELTSRPDYSLVIIDTSPISSKNRNNFDPIALARQADASILLISQGILKNFSIDTYLEEVKDPHIRLIGVVENNEVLT